VVKNYLLSNSMLRCGSTARSRSTTDRFIAFGIVEGNCRREWIPLHPHTNGLVDKQRLNGERWNRWVALGLDQRTKKSGGSYQMDDRVTVFRVSKDGVAVEKNALELLMEQT
jgi:hypothetical protein